MQPEISTFTGKFINVGAPKSDNYTSKVFELRLQKADPKLPITDQTLEALRKQLLDFVNTLNGNNNSLDIIADAKGGEQLIFGSSLKDILDKSSETAETLVQAIRSHFRQFRLLGCVTGDTDTEAWEYSRDLANRLDLPAIATLWWIDYSNFNDVSFMDIKDGQTLVTEIDPGETDSAENVARRISAVRQLQAAWFASAAHTTVVASDLIGEPSVPVWTWQLPFELVGKTAVIDAAIGTFVDAVVMVRTPSGQRFEAQLLARSTLMGFRSRKYGMIYLNIPPDDPQRLKWLREAPKPWPYRTIASAAHRSPIA